MYDLALMYHYGAGVKKSNKEAFKLMRLVADELFDEEEEIENFEADSVDLPLEDPEMD